MPAKTLADVPQTPGVAKPDPILVVENMKRHFGGLTAVDVEHVEIPRGAITALIGPNGAGKTTLFNLLTGFDTPNAGSWTLREAEGKQRNLRNLGAHRIAQEGVVRTFQLTKALAALTVQDNMALAAPHQRGESFWVGLIPQLWRAQEKAISQRAETLLGRFNLDGKAAEYAGTLSGGQRKLLEMARALMAEPTLIMLDEPMAGVNPALSQRICQHIQQLREDGLTVLFVEHDMDVVRNLSDWVIVMAEGRVIAEGTPESIAANPAVIDAYLGAHHEPPKTRAEEEAQIAAAEKELAVEAITREEER